MPTIANQRAAQEVIQYVEGTEAYRSGRRIPKDSQERMRNLLDLSIEVGWWLLADAAIADGNFGSSTAHAKLSLKGTVAKLNRIFEEYPSQPVVTLSAAGTVNFDEQLNTKFHPLHECRIARWIFVLCENTAILHFKRCSCGERFFARTLKQTSCRAQCRHSKYEKTEDFKTLRREYRKRRYQEEKIRISSELAATRRSPRLARSRVTKPAK
jgi:hypothetical protein